MKKTAFVSGSSRGIGRAIAVELARRGFAVAINGRAESAALSQTLNAIEAAGGHGVAVPGDVTQPANIAPLLDRVEAALGPITTLVANAGAGPLRRADILEVAPDGLMHCLTANTVGPFFLVQECARRMLGRQAPEGQHTSISIISSANATAASPNKADYCISKAGTAMIAKLFAQKLSPHGVQVVDIRPGVIETDLSAAVIDEYRRRIAEEDLALFPRVGQPEDIAKVAGCIADGDLPYVTGSVIAVDGGLSAERF
ncbi:3-ketoacyl-ACP reductase [Antarctobacter heliothermus]|uniref:NAD(P)-dependent dehydrogenase, short-chain alcohol dehydrogenase family n=1 Tax=Antarctobacter heliothermus TaxID=74033 RepID=A0A239L022_9RHOB|nr:3-ketoacyl-ACP reductase [Antarctobacter heliothermus]SNT23332.1 NAD(P)-dependent dehydrogenase, short-chain alcohol dehydrogenase family [Antarctobacter heliothermus]